MSPENKLLLQQVIDHLNYLEGKNSELFKQEIQTACDHYAINKKVNYDLGKFKISIDKVL